MLRKVSRTLQQKGRRGLTEQFYRVGPKNLDLPPCPPRSLLEHVEGQDLFSVVKTMNVSPSVLFCCGLNYFPKETRWRCLSCFWCDVSHQLEGVDDNCLTGSDTRPLPAQVCGFCVASCESAECDAPCVSRKKSASHLDRIQLVATHRHLDDLLVRRRHLPQVVQFTVEITLKLNAVFFARKFFPTFAGFDYLVSDPNGRQLLLTLALCDLLFFTLRNFDPCFPQLLFSRQRQCVR